jgi:hypothetical protein
MVKREIKQNCKRAVCKGVKRRTEKETVKDSEKDIREMSVNLSYVTEDSAKVNTEMWSRKNYNETVR